MNAPVNGSIMRSLARLAPVIFFSTAFLLLPILVRAQQCTLPSRIFLPTADEVPFQGFGEAVEVHGDYMVVGMSGNCSQQVYSGMAFVYKLTPDHQWEKIAELTPSDPDKYRQFGRQVGIYGTSIVILASEYTDEGFGRQKLYVYEKPLAGEWTSVTEDYVIAKGFSTGFTWNIIGEFALHGNELLVQTATQASETVEVYTKSGGIFSLSQTINVPDNGPGTYEWRLAVTDTYFAIATEQYSNPDMSIGVVFVYEREAVGYKTTPAVLRASDQSPTTYALFGFAIGVTNTTLYVVGLRGVDADYKQTYYVFEKNASGWTDSKQPFMLETPSYLWRDIDLAVSDDYFFIADPEYKSVIGFKKPAAGWSSAATKFIINDLPAETFVFGYELELNDNHLVVGCASRNRSIGKSEELIADYYTDTGNWGDPVTACHQKLRGVQVHATDDFFGEAFAVHNNQLAIAALGDDENGSNTGVIYIFDTQKQSATPEQKVYCPETENSTGFGSSMAMGDSIMFIAAPYKDSLGIDGTPKFHSIGKVYVYRLTASGWQYSSQIVAPKVHSSMYFGRNVVCSPGYVAVTEFYGGSSESVGHVYIYKENTSGKFEYLATLDPSTHLRSDFFGKSMLMTDSMMVIGTGNFAPNSSYRMSVYVFIRKGEWKTTSTEDASLMSTDSGWSDRFGASVSMYGNYIVVGAPYSPGYDPRPIPRDYIISGAAYIYKRPPGGWKGLLTETAKLSPSDPTDLGAFGTSVAIDHDDIFVGSPNVYALYNYSHNFTNNDGALIPGRVYHYKKPPGGWVTTKDEERKMLSFEPEIVDGYGANMFVSDRYLYVGAMLDDTQSGFRTGSVQTMMQLPVIDSLAVSCSDQTVVKLHGFPRGGVWTGPGINSAQGTFNPAIAGAGTHTINYSIHGCEASTSASVLPDALTVFDQSQPEREKCIGQSVPLVFHSNETPDHYKWEYRATPTASYSSFASATQEITATKPGTYRVTVTRAICPGRTEEFTITDEDPVSIAIDPVPIVCADEMVTLSATPESGKWYGQGTTSEGTFAPAGLKNGDYKVRYEIITALGCKWKDSVMVSIDMLKVPAMLEHDDEICGSSAVTLKLDNVDNRSTVTWYNEDSGMALTEGLELAVTLPGTYSATVSKHHCSFETSPVTLSAVQDSLFVPNVFTPNNDTYNDTFEMSGEGFDRNFYLAIFNRHGKPVFETSNPAFKWSAENIASGVYFWRVSYRDCFRVAKEQKGWVQVIK